MGKLNGKRALVTGGSSGIGLACARLFLAEGARVAITGSREDALAAAHAALGDVLAIRSDAGRIADQKSLAETIAKAWGGLDVLHVNAGVADFRPLEQWDEAGFDRSFAINVKGPFFLIQALLPLFANPAAIVLTSSINANIGMPASSVYAATKGALATFARTLSGELLARGVRVNAISPGPVATPLHDMFDEAGLAALTAQIPLGRRGTVEEIAKAALYFACEDSAFTVGAELIVDGGMSTL